MPGELILYTTEDGASRIQLHAEGGTVWLTQMELAELFQTSKQNISLHIKNILAERELTEEATVKEYLTVQLEGGREVKRTKRLYNLDMILAVGYRVRSLHGIQFRQWAGTILKEYLVKGYTMDDDRLKLADNWDYYDDWLARIRDIRSSEKRFYQKVRDLFCTAVDYDKTSEQAKLFFKVVQNKMLWAVTGRTAAEIIAGRSDPALPNMGLTSWEGRRVRSQDVTTSKNYLRKGEMDALNRIVTMYLDYAENRALSRRAMTMTEWAEKLDAFLRFNEQEVLTHAGKISADVAEKLALDRYAEFDAKRREAERLKADAEDALTIENMTRELEEQKRAGTNALPAKPEE
jgi:hypothetical protein